jgi:hypothetical protein
LLLLQDSKKIKTNTMMSHNDIHEIISQISQSLDCPQCRTRILPHNIAITDIMGADCMFDVACHNCEAEMTLSAHIEKNLTDDAKVYNRSSQIMHDNMIEKEVSKEDVLAIRKEMKNFCGSFIEAFCR